MSNTHNSLTDSKALLHLGRIVNKPKLTNKTINHRVSYSEKMTVLTMINIHEWLNQKLGRKTQIILQPQNQPTFHARPLGPSTI
jgi:hypothetical protein